ncbi:MAG: hypothetical protein V3S09_04665 [Candidatus Bathyarchaeia archaeon]
MTEVEEINDGDYGCGFCNKDSWYSEHDDYSSSKIWKAPCGSCVFPELIASLKELKEVMTK